MLALGLLPEFQCHTCTAIQKQNRGCEEDAPIPYQIDGEDHARCPRRPIFEEPELWNDLLMSFHDYEAGRFPEDGGMQDQPYKYTNTMWIMAAAKSEAEDIKDRARKAQDGVGKPG